MRVYFPFSFIYTRTHVVRKHVSRTSNLYPDTYMSTDKCRRIQVARPGYMLTVSRRHKIYYSFMPRSTCIPLYPSTDGRQTGDSFVPDTRNMLTATCIRQHVSWCKRGIRRRNTVSNVPFLHIDTKFNYLWTSGDLLDRKFVVV